MSLCETCNVASTCGKFKSGCGLPDVFCVRNFKMNCLFDAALVSGKQRTWMPLRYDADGTDRYEMQRLNDIAKNIEVFVSSGKNLYIHSAGCGNGKTSWALRIIQEYIKKTWFKTSLGTTVLFVNVPKFFLQLKDNIREQNEYISHIKESVATCDLVVWDDIGTKVGTEFELENLLNIINNRIDNGKSNIYTSNISPEQLRTRVGDRLYSRIVNMSENIQLNGADKRGI